MIEGIWKITCACEQELERNTKEWSQIFIRAQDYQSLLKILLLVIMIVLQYKVK